MSDAYVFTSITEVQEITDPWLIDYNEDRPHDSLGRVPPATFKPRPTSSTGGVQQFVASLTGKLTGETKSYFVASLAARTRTPPLGFSSLAKGVFSESLLRLLRVLMEQCPSKIAPS